MNAMRELKLTSEMCTCDGNGFIKKHRNFSVRQWLRLLFFPIPFRWLELVKGLIESVVCTVIGNVSSLFAQSIARIKSIAPYAMPLPTCISKQVNSITFSVAKYICVIAPRQFVHLDAAASTLSLACVYVPSLPSLIPSIRWVCSYSYCVRVSVCFPFIRNRIVFPCIQRKAPSTTKSTTTIDATISLKRIEPKRTESQCDNIGPAYPHRHSFQLVPGNVAFECDVSSRIRAQFIVTIFAQFIQMCYWKGNVGACVIRLHSRLNQTFSLWICFTDKPTNRHSVFNHTL